MQTPALLLVILAVLQSTGCTTFRPIDYATPQELTLELSAGHRLRILCADGDTIELRAVSIEPDFIVGTTRDGGEIRIALGEIQSIERRAIAPAKTAGLAAGLVMLYEFVYVGVAVHAIVTGF